MLWYTARGLPTRLLENEQGAACYFGLEAGGCLCQGCQTDKGPVPARKDRFCSPANTTQHTLHWWMLKGSKWKGCGVRSFLTDHSCANGGCHQGSPRMAGSQQTPPRPPSGYALWTLQCYSQEELQGHLLLTPSFQASQRKPCLARQNSIQLVPTVQTCSQITTPGNKTKAGKELKRRLQNWREGPNESSQVLLKVKQIAKKSFVLWKEISVSLIQMNKVASKIKTSRAKAVEVFHYIISILQAWNPTLTLKKSFTAWCRQASCLADLSLSIFTCKRN